jgi:hypothetical protein
MDHERQRSPWTALITNTSGFSIGINAERRNIQQGLCSPLELYISGLLCRASARGKCVYCFFCIFCSFALSQNAGEMSWAVHISGGWDLPAPNPHDTLSRSPRADRHKSKRIESSRLQLLQQSQYLFPHILHLNLFLHPQPATLHFKLLPLCPSPPQHDDHGIPD